MHQDILNHIRLECAEHEGTALTQALEGPAMPWFPEETYDPRLLRKIESAHHRIELEHLKSAAQEAVAQIPDCPDWYEVSLGDTLAYQQDPTLTQSPKRERIPLSLMRFRPWNSRQEMNAWKSDPQWFLEAIFGLRSALQDQSGGWLIDSTQPGIFRATLTLRSAWVRPSNPVEFVLPALRRHRAHLAWICADRTQNEIAGWWFNGSILREIPDMPLACDDDMPDLPGPGHTVMDTQDAEARLIEAGVPQNLVAGIFS